MANVTDPLARAVHGTNPQNLIEYITRQKIYDSLYWKEECFGLSASDVATKASDLQAMGGSYGGNNKPTRFLCLALKLLQIQPEEGIVEEFLQNEDFKYVRALGAFYLRLTGRPAEIYELIEPLYNDFRKLRFRESTGWKITYMDEVADELLNSDRYCGIALPHLPKRAVLESAGYLDGPRRSALVPLIDEEADGDAEQLLQKMADNGNAAAKAAIDERMKRKAEAEEKEAQILLERQKEASIERGKRSDRIDGRGSNERDHYKDSERDQKYRDYNRESRRQYDDETHQHRNDRRKDDYRSHRESDHDRTDRRRRDEYNNNRNHGRRYDDRGYRDEPHGSNSTGQHDCQQSDHDHEQSARKSQHRKEKKSSKHDEKYGSLFKKSSNSEGARSQSSKKLSVDKDGVGNNANVIEGSEEFWNDERAKLGLKPLNN
mmetsp:Transcript_12435/g.24844  ORF Transcript_12435/g.24844 Transcript_12435/m.24844 type:complete len:433 (+) Transcript_12435:164-1462(+)